MAIVTIYGKDRQLFGLDSEMFSEKNIYNNDGYINKSFTVDLFSYVSNELKKENTGYSYYESFETKKYSEIEKLRTNKWITKNEILDRIQEIEKYETHYMVKTIITKDKYELIPNNYITTLQQVSNVWQTSYDWPHHDCDDYSFRLDGDIKRFHPQLACGYMTARGYDRKDDDEIHHAFMLGFNENKELGLIEPQNTNGLTSISEFALYDLDRKLIYM